MFYYRSVGVSKWHKLDIKALCEQPQQFSDLQKLL